MSTKLLSTGFLKLKLTIRNWCIYIFQVFFKISGPLIEDYTTRMGLILKVNHIPMSVSHQRKHKTWMEPIQWQTLTNNSKHWLRWLYLCLIIFPAQAVSLAWSFNVYQTWFYQNKLNHETLFRNQVLLLYNEWFMRLLSHWIHVFKGTYW